MILCIYEQEFEGEKDKYEYFIDNIILRIETSSSEDFAFV